ncbi:DUF2726 domain-containing protein [Serratia fonticola]|uniref:DUF2726 domain-containing protein n=1 Tax=Serratia fonticola TaxID=47917 RepID=A0AAJ1YE32_SERFO|nr:DUF2726 domain-containing protein [Serratia fonticola]MDQ9128458.1 DUF2726 domain-containing protein [Serratia fonticola]
MSMSAVLLVLGVVLFGVVLVTLLAKRGRSSHPMLGALREAGVPPREVDRLLCQTPSYVAAGSLMTAREQRFFSQLCHHTDESRWRLCPQVRVADVVNVATNIKRGTKAWWTLFQLVSQWHCDVVVIDRASFAVVAVIELDDNSHRKPERQRRDILLAEVLSQAGIPLLRGADAPTLTRQVEAFLQARA